MAQNLGFPVPPSQHTPGREDRSDHEPLERLAHGFAPFPDPKLALHHRLHELAEQVQCISGLSGCSIGLVEGNDFICRAASGESAPAVGTRIQSEDGLSAECVRTRHSQICQDTQTDSRVDAAACRAVGVRSVIVVPLLSQRNEKLIGVLEAFSLDSHAFGIAVSERIEAVARRVVDVLDPSQSAPLSHEPQPKLSPTPLASVGRRTTLLPPASGGSLYKPARQSQTNLMLAVSVLAAGVVLAGLLVWVQQEKVRRDTLASAISAPTTTLTPATSIGSADANPSSPPQAPIEIHAQRIALTKTSSPKPRLAKTPVTADPSPLGDLVVYEKGKVIYRAGPITPASETERLGETANPATAAVSNSPTSTAFTGGALRRRVPPVYPAEAFALRLEGDVVLQGIIGKDGEVRDIRVLSGDAHLVDSATTAVRQWRYDPFRSNGEPVDMLSTVTVHFRLPQASNR